MPERTRRASPEDFKLLGLGVGASPADVKKAYKTYVKTWHPDRYAQGSRQQRRAEERLKEGNAAYRRIRDDWEAEKSEQRTATTGQPSPRETRRPASSPSPGKAPMSTPWLTKRAWKGFLQAKLDTVARSNVPKSRASRFSALMLAVLLLGIGSLLFVEPTPVPVRHGAPPSGRRTDVPSPLPHDSLLLNTSKADTPQEPLALGKPTSSPTPANPYPTPETSDADLRRPFFSIGSSKTEVLRIQGEPTKIYGQKWVYGLSDITFRDGKVWRYHNFDGTLKVQIIPSVPAENTPIPDSFGLGATRDQVLQVQGTPTQIDKNKWSYGFSEVYFKDGLVSGFNNFFNNLKVSMRPSGALPAVRARGHFTLGSTQDEVLAVQGTPMAVRGNQWSYRLSDILFVEGRVRSVNDFSGVLRYLPPDSIAEK